MKKEKNILTITAVLVTLAIWGFIFFLKDSLETKGLDLAIFVLIILLSAIALFRAFKKNKEQKEGFPADDEMSQRIKYKAGYLAYMGSMYMWLFIFLLKDKFPDTETMLGGGILASAAMIFVIEYFVKQKLHEE
jgi:hypothetical protein